MGSRVKGFWRWRNGRWEFVRPHWRSSRVRFFAWLGLVLIVVVLLWLLPFAKPLPASSRFGLQPQLDQTEATLAPPLAN